MNTQLRKCRVYIYRNHVPYSYPGHGIVEDIVNGVRNSVEDIARFFYRFLKEKGFSSYYEEHDYEEDNTYTIVAGASITHGDEVEKWINVRDELLSILRNKVYELYLETKKKLQQYTTKYNIKESCEKKPDQYVCSIYMEFLVHPPMLCNMLVEFSFSDEEDDKSIRASTIYVCAEQEDLGEDVLNKMLDNVTIIGYYHEPVEVKHVVLDDNNIYFMV